MHDIRHAWLVIPAASVVPAFLDAGQMWLKLALDDNPSTDWGAVVFQGMEWLFLGTLAPIAWYLARRVPFDRTGWKRALAAHGAGTLVLCVGWASLGIVLGRWLDHWVAQGRLGQAYLNWLLTSVPWSVFMYFTVLGCVYAFVYFNEARAREVQTAVLGAQLADARLGALRMQLHPHFLFNTLNTLAVFVRERNTRAASRVLELLGDMLRRLLRSDRPHEVALADELEFIEQYLEIETVRFPDRLRVTWSIDPDAPAPAGARASRCRGGSRRDRRILRAVLRERRHGSRAADGDRVGHEGLLCRGPRRVHYCFWGPAHGEVSAARPRLLLGAPPLDLLKHASRQSNVQRPSTLLQLLKTRRHVKYAA